MVLQFCLLYRVALWTFWYLFVVVMTYYFFNLNFCKWAPYYLALAYLGASF